MYNCVGSTIIGSPVGIFLGVSIGEGTGWEERMSFGLVPEGATVDSLSDYDDVRIRL